MLCLSNPKSRTVKQYTPEVLDLHVIFDKSYEKLGKQPFQWQLEAAAAVLCGKGVCERTW